DAVGLLPPQHAAEAMLCARHASRQRKADTVSASRSGLRRRQMKRMPISHVSPPRNMKPFTPKRTADRDVPPAVKAEPVGDRADEPAARAVPCKRLRRARVDRQVRARPAHPDEAAAGPIAADDDCCARAPLSERLETLRLEWGGSRRCLCR